MKTQKQIEDEKERLAGLVERARENIEFMDKAEIDRKQLSDWSIRLKAGMEALDWVLYDEYNQIVY